MKGTYMYAVEDKHEQCGGSWWRHCDKSRYMYLGGCRVDWRWLGHLGRVGEQLGDGGGCSTWPNKDLEARNQCGMGAGGVKAEAATVVGEVILAK